MCWLSTSSNQKKNQPLAPSKGFFEPVGLAGSQNDALGCSRTFIGEGLGAREIMIFHGNWERRKSMSNDTKDVEII